jgi:DNA-binding response OmpR family regulator
MSIIAGSGNVILVIEDDPVVSHLVVSTLQREGMIVLSAANGNEGLRMVAESRPTLVLLDIVLPDLDGWSILRRLRTDCDYQPAVIMLTTRKEEPDRILGLDLGADDYIGKPFSARELVARVRAVMRRVNRPSDSGREMRFPGLRIDIPGRSVWRNDESIHLTPKEFDLLVTLAGRPSQVFTRSILYDTIWGEAGQGDEHTLDVHVDRLRRKLAASDGGRSFIKTIKGVGFKFIVPSEEQ